jgi:hypothetical protein
MIYLTTTSTLNIHTIQSSYTPDLTACRLCNPIPSMKAQTMRPTMMITATYTLFVVRVPRHLLSCHRSKTHTPNTHRKSLRRQQRGQHNRRSHLSTALPSPRMRLGGPTWTGISKELRPGHNMKATPWSHRRHLRSNNIITTTTITRTAPVLLHLSARTTRFSFDSRLPRCSTTPAAPSPAHA